MSFNAIPHGFQMGTLYERKAYLLLPELIRNYLHGRNIKDATPTQPIKGRLNLQCSDVTNICPP